MRGTILIWLFALMAAAAHAQTGETGGTSGDGDIRMAPFVFKDVPVVNLAAAHPNEVLVEGDVAWTYTGVLDKPLDLHRGIYGTVTIPAGEKFYGIPLSGPGAATGRLSWCSPRPDGNTGRWNATCLIAIDGGYVLQRPMSPPFTLTAILMPKLAGPNATAIAVTRQPVDFGVTVHVAYLVHKFSDKVLLLDKRISITGYKTITYPNLKAFVQPDGAAFVLIGGAILRLTHDGADAFRVDVLRHAGRATSINPVGLGETTAPVPHASSGTSQ